MIINGTYPFITIVASIASTDQMTVTSVTNGVLSAGLMVGGQNVPANMFIILQISGVPGGPGVYLVGCYALARYADGEFYPTPAVFTPPLPTSATLPSQQMLVAPWTVNAEETIISQYANSPTLLNLINNSNQYIDPQTNLFNFYNQVWNVNSATGYGLDLWGRIVGVSRYLPTSQSAGFFNFRESLIGTEFGPAGTAPFSSGSHGQGTTRLLDPAFRTLVFAKALANISICSAPLVNKILTMLFGTGVSVGDVGNMQMPFNVVGTLTSNQLAILLYSGVVPRPVGVQTSVNYTGPITGTLAGKIPSITGAIGSIGSVAGSSTSLAFKIIGSISGTASNLGGSTVVALSNSTAYAGLANTVNTSGTVLITANVTGLTNTTVTWKVDGIANGNSTVGTINTGTAMGTANQWGNTVLYTAPSTTGSHSIVAYANDGTPSPATVMSIQIKAYSVANSTAISVHAPSGNATTDTGYINAALATASSGGGGVVNLATGTYNVTGVGSGGEWVFNVPANVTVVIPTGCTVSLSGAPSGGQAGIFNINASNINIVGGGTINGNSVGNNCAGIFIQGASNICVAGLTIENCSSNGYDGITIEGYYTPSGYNVQYVLVYGCTISSNGRNGMAPCGQDYLVVRDCTLSNNEHNPAAGIDFEPTSSGSFVQRATYGMVFNCTMNNNTDGTYGGLIQSGPDDSSDSGYMNNMVFAFNTGSANCGFGIEAQNCANVQILNNTISGTTNGLYGGWGILLRGSNSSPQINNVLVLGNSLSSNYGGAIISEASNASSSYIEYNSAHGQTISGQSGVTVANNT